MSDRMCSVETCDEPQWARGFCGTHYQRFRLTGDPQANKPIITNARGKDHPSFIAHPGYKAMHDRVRAERGPASQYLCEQCGERAKDWCYGQTDPEALTDHLGRVYSLDPERYLPLCAGDHRRFDLLHQPERFQFMATVLQPTWEARRKKTHCKRGHEFTPENTQIKQPGDRRACRECGRQEQRDRKARERAANQAVLEEPLFQTSDPIPEDPHR